jgi:hypothetical protein
MGMGGKGPVPVVKPGEHERTEFIIVFIWQEPTPSDGLRGQTEGAK